LRSRAQNTHVRGNVTLWFGFLGGALAWTLHLLASYLLAEGSCAPALAVEGTRVSSTVAILMHSATLAGALVALAATLSARSQWQRWRGDADRSGRAYIGLAGVFVSGAFLLIILIEGLPPLLVPPCA
jgi:hypothetical protein